MTKNTQMVDITSPLRVGSLKCRNRVFLAPMSGISDVVFRKFAWKFGAGLVFSEMVASEALASGQEEMRMKARSAGFPVHAVQIAGRQAKWMTLAARMAEASGANLIDIQYGMSGAAGDQRSFRLRPDARPGPRYGFNRSRYGRGENSRHP